MIHLWLWWLDGHKRTYTPDEWWAELLSRGVELYDTRRSQLMFPCRLTPRQFRGMADDFLAQYRARPNPTNWTITVRAKP